MNNTKEEIQRAIDAVISTLAEWAGQKSLRLEGSCSRFETIKAALEAYAANQWQPIETAPKDGSLIYLFGKNVSGKTRRIQARYTQKHKEIAEDCDNTEWLDELADEYYYPEGWYEISWCNDDYHMYKVHDYNIQPTHWMPLPPSPSDKGAE